MYLLINKIITKYIKIGKDLFKDIFGSISEIRQMLRGVQLFIAER